MGPEGIISSVTSKLTDPDTLKDIALNIISKQNLFNDDIENPFKISYQFITEFGGKGLSAIESHAGISTSQVFSPLGKLFSSKKQKEETTKNILTEIQDFIIKTDNLYKKISKDKKSALEKERELRKQRLKNQILKR